MKETVGHIQAINEFRVQKKCFKSVSQTDINRNDYLKTTYTENKLLKTLRCDTKARSYSEDKLRAM